MKEALLNKSCGPPKGDYSLFGPCVMMRHSVSPHGSAELEARYRGLGFLRIARHMSVTYFQNGCAILVQVLGLSGW